MHEYDDGKWHRLGKIPHAQIRIHKLVCRMSFDINTRIDPNVVSQIEQQLPFSNVIRAEGCIRCGVGVCVHFVLNKYISLSYKIKILSFCWWSLGCRHAIGKERSEYLRMQKAKAGAPSVMWALACMPSHFVDSSVGICVFVQILRSSIFLPSEDMRLWLERVSIPNFAAKQMQHQWLWLAKAAYSYYILHWQSYRVRQTNSNIWHYTYTSYVIIITHFHFHSI